MASAKWVLFFAFLTLACGSAASAALPVAKRNLVERGPTYDVNFQYPRTGNATIDKAIESWARDFAKGFEESAVRDHQAQVPRPYTAHMRFDIARNDRDVFAVVFHYAFDLGGVHPNSATFTFNFLMPDGWRVYLAEVVKPDGFARLSELAVADLDRRVASGPDALSTDEWVRRGAAPYSYNFGEFTLLKNEILVYFDPYQVAAYAAGPQAAHIPFGKLKGVLRPDWRAPQPSFDCAKARTSIEHALCSDVTLARLDRDVADEYFHQTANDPESSYAAQIKAAQRQWLAKRDGDCEDVPQIVACLTASYQARMRKLLPPE